MNKIHDIVRLLLTSPLSNRQIARSLDVSRRTVDRYRTLVDAGEHSWATMKDMSGKALSALFNRLPKPTSKIPPDLDAIERERAVHGSKLADLWEDYRREHGERALGFSRFARLCKLYRKARGVSMRKVHRAGEAVFVDYSGRRPHYTNPSTGEEVPVELFVGVLGASRYTFATCTATQTVPDFLDAHSRMVAFFGGTPQSVVPDNLRSAVSRSGSEPLIQRNFQDWARHHDMAVLPARPGHPRDKGAVENAVKHVQNWLLPKLSKRQFFSLETLNEAVAKLMVGFNEKPFQKRAGSRKSEFERIERAALRPLPKERFEFCTWTAKQVVPKDYHIVVYGHYYSVPYRLVGQRAEARVSATHVDIFCDNEKVASHRRSLEQHGQTTDRAHMPWEHQAEKDRTPEGMREWARTVGPAMAKVMEEQFARQRIPLQGLTSAVALRNLGKGVAVATLEAAAQTALELKVPNVTGVKRALDRVLSNQSEKALDRGRVPLAPLTTPKRQKQKLRPPKLRKAGRA